MKLHGNPMSTCTRKVLMTLAEKGQEVEFVLVDLSTGAQKKPENLALQPFGKVPALVDDGFVLYESRAIARYLDGKLGGPSLTPADARDRARMEQWISVETSYVSAPAMAIVYQLMMNPMRGLPTDAAAVEKGRDELGKALDVLDRALEKQPFLVGDKITLADIMFMPYLQYVQDCKQTDVITQRPHVAAWWERLSARPAWKKVLSMAPRH